MSQPQAAGLSAIGLSKHKDRGLLGKLKDKALGTREEREAEWRRRQEAVSRYATLQPRSESDTLYRIAFVWKRSDSVSSR